VRWEGVARTLQEFRQALTVAVETTERAGWHGVQVGDRYFAWDGPQLHALADRPGIPSPRTAMDALKQGGHELRFHLPHRLPEAHADGWSQVFETDRMGWRRALLHGEGQVLLVRPAPVPQPVQLGRGLHAVVLVWTVLVRTWRFLKRPWAAFAAFLVVAVSALGVLQWWQSRIRVSVEVRHYVHGPLSEKTVSELRGWVVSHPGRAYDVADVVWRNVGSVPANDFTILVTVRQDAEILTCELAEPSLRPLIRLERRANQCAVSLDRVAAGSTDSVRLRYRSPVVNWLYECDLHGWKGDMCAAARPSADSSYQPVVTAQDNGPPIRVRMKVIYREWP
jgi:hypothetical protein